MTDTTTLTNRALAERLGWRDFYERVEGSGVRQKTVLYGKRPDGFEAVVPAYLTDANAALTLPLPPGYQFRLYGALDSWHCYVENEVGALVNGGTGAHGDAAAGVVCAAWWQLMEGNDANR